MRRALGGGVPWHPQRCCSPACGAPCRSQGAGDGAFPGQESLAAFLCWLDYLDELVLSAHPVRSTRLLAQSRGSAVPVPGSAPALAVGCGRGRR